MPTVLSKPVLAGGSLNPRPWAPEKRNQATSEANQVMLAAPLEIPGHDTPGDNRPFNSHETPDDEPQLTDIQLRMLRAKKHLQEFHDHITKLRSAQDERLSMGEASLIGTPYFDEARAIRQSLEMIRATKIIAEQFLTSMPDSLKPPPLTLDADKEQNLRVMNGQMKLQIHNWRSPKPGFVMRNNPQGNPKTGLDGVIEENGFAEVDFQMPLDFPGGMSGFLGVLKSLFISPKMIGITQMEAGSAVANQESRNTKKAHYHIKWTTPWENTGCRVSWMKEKEKSSDVKFKFVNMQNASPEEQVLVTFDERDKYYQSISQKDPNLCGKWMAMPVRIWLHTQAIVSQYGPVENTLFNKLSAHDNVTSIAKKKNKGRSRRSRKKSSKNSTCKANEEPEAPEELEAQEECDAAKDNISEITEVDSAAVLNPEQPTSGEVDDSVPMGQQGNLTKEPPTLTIDTERSNKRWKHKRNSRSDGTTEVKDTHQLTHRRGNSLHGLNTNIPFKSLLAEFVPFSDQHHTLNSSSPILSGSLQDSASSFETARSQLTPLTSLPSSTPSQFFTPMSAQRENNKEHPEAWKDKLEPEEPPSQRSPIPPKKDLVELRRLALNTTSELYFSDPEDYITDSKALKVIRPRKDSADAIRLGLFEGLQKNTVSSPMADPPLTSHTSCDQATTDSNSTELVTERPISQATVQDPNQARVEARAKNKKTVYKKRKSERRKRKDCQRREETRDEALDDILDTIPEHPSSETSSSHGVEGHNPSPREASNEEEQTPKAMQHGDIGAPSSQMVLDLTTLAVPCAKPDCSAICGFKDGVSVICPKCGPYSMTRYCGKIHLWEDVKAHWAECSTHPIEQPCLTSSISADALVGPPLLPCLHQWDTPARHRQAVWFSSASERGDYFIFADWTDQMGAGDDPASHMRLRCSPQVALTVRFEDAEEKDRFRRCLAICLFAAVEHPALVDYLYRLIRDWMRAHSSWASENDVDGMLCDQMSREMGGNIHPARVGLRHACETEWVGANRRHCEDPTCATERPPVLLGNQGVGLGFRRVCEYLESKYWILRAHRATHPSVSDVGARTCGGGFSEVLTVDRRFFRRGEGWDGAGTGPLELEWP
ncbi:hypothetical protein N7457_007092 [Penicillium paradoxum]|uniref:uncharacterized protein n=1 Tax=Penicillium paradoxum TaxID=176176 RepID=UPI00254706D7|nr:uncharacterized protein N7457_007092 [Penicillium paradoxum]KAJ5779372.1 hypothetical protein N7457_007092 [Penicillium paradoxum]